MYIQNTKAIFEIVGIVAAIFVAAFGIVQYIDAKERAQVEYSLRFYEKLSSSEIYLSIAKIDKSWIDGYSIIEGQAKKGDEAYRNAANSIIERYDLEISIFTVLDFYDALNACITTDVCSYRVSTSLFCERMSEFRQKVYYYVRDIQKTSNENFGSGLTNLWETMTVKTPRGRSCKT